MTASLGSGRKPQASQGSSRAPSGGSPVRKARQGSAARQPAPAAADQAPQAAAALSSAQVFPLATYTRPHPARAMSDAERRAWLWTDNPSGDTAILACFLRRWRCDPVAFAFEAARYALMPYQAQALLDLADAPADVYAFYGLDPSYPKGKVLLPSGHGLGKTTLAAMAIWWHKLCHKASKQLATAPTADQLTGQLMGEVRKIFRNLEANWPMLAQDWDVQGSGIVHRDAKWRDWQTMFRTARSDQPEALQGGHALDAIDPFGDLAKIWGTPPRQSAHGGMLIVLEEASGIPDDIRKTLEGSLSERGARLLAPGNPTRADGWFAEDITKPDIYAVHHLDCRLSDIHQVYSLPYRPPGQPPSVVRTHGFVRPEYWQGILADCDGDENADYFRVRVRGMPPASNVTQVIRREWIEAAMQRPYDQASLSEPVVLGADFGLMADKHALAAVQGYNVLDLVEWLIPNNPEEQLEAAFERILEWRAQYDARTIVGDSNGVGAGVMSRLTAHFRAPERRALGVAVIHFQAGQGAINHTRFSRRRDEMWYQHGRALLSSPRCHLPSLPGLAKQLSLPGFIEDTRRIIQVESKKDIKRRTGEASGNAADALLMTQMVRAARVTETAEPAPPVLSGPFQRHFRRLRAAAAGDLIA